MPGEEQAGPDQQGAPDDHPGSGDEGRARGESPFGLPLNRPGAGSPGSGSSPAGFGAGFGGGPGGGFPGLPDLGGMDPSDLGAMLERVLGEAADNPELAEVMKSMGVDPTDPATQAAMRAQLGTFMAAQESPTGSRDMATEVARRHVMTVEGNDVHDEAAARAVADAVSVATLWLDEQTTLASPAWRATGLSRAEWVEATMPRWFELIEPVSDGVTAATSDAMRKQVGELGPEAFGEALPEGLPEGFDPRRDGRAVGADARQPQPPDVLGPARPGRRHAGDGGRERHRGRACRSPSPASSPCCPATSHELAESLEIDVAQVRLYLAVREAARVRLFSEVPWLGPQLLSAVSDYARNITIDTEAIESALSTIDPSDPEALRSALQGNLFRPQPTPAQRAALDRLETLLALAEGWVDHVTDRTTAQHLPQSAALAETIRRRRVGGAAQKTFAGLVGLELRPRRLRDAANLWAALESAGGATLRDGRWAHPDLAPTSADLDDPIGYVERATGEGAAGAVGAPEAVGAGLGADLDSVLQGILEEADRERGTAPGSAVHDDRSDDDEQQSGDDGDAGPTR